MKLAIYDFDGTYVNIQTLPELYKRWKVLHVNDRSHRLIWRKIMVRYIFHKLHLFGWTKRRFHPYTMEQTANLFQTVDQGTLSNFLQENYNNLKQYISDTMKQQLQEDHDNGYHTVLLSGNFDIILQPFQQDGFDTVIGSTSQKNGRLLTSKEVNIIIEDGKREAILQSFPEADLANSKAYADSGYDLPILELVGHPICVNPDTTLEAIAKQREYPILWTT